MDEVVDEVGGGGEVVEVVEEVGGGDLEVVFDEVVVELEVKVVGGGAGLVPRDGVAEQVVTCRPAVRLTSPSC